jgi:MFS family permease
MPAEILTTTPEPTTAEKIAKLRWSIASNAANTVFVQFTFFGSVFVLFLDTLGLNKSQIGFLLSLFPFFGLVALFIAPTAARYGYKRTFLIFFAARKFITILLLLTPWVLVTSGPQITLLFVSGVVMVFALCRAVAETARFPWVQEYVPNSVRGKYSASNNMVSTILGFISVTVAGFVLARSTGLGGFMLLLGVGIVFGFLSTWAAIYIPGGAPVRPTEQKTSSYRGMALAAQDKNFLFYLLGSGLVVLVITPLNSFIPLFMQEEVGLDSGQVVWLQNGALVGGLVSTYLWGWLSDRYGSRPVMLYGVGLIILLPIFWFVMPRFAAISLVVALTIAFVKGVAFMGWNIGSARMLFVSVVPPRQKTEYMAVYFAWIGVVGGISQLAGGQLLESSEGISSQFFSFSLDSFSPLFALSFGLTLVSFFILRRVRADDRVSLTGFAGLFFRGNPFLAMGSLIGYHLAKDEESAVAMTERLGQTRSLLPVDELLEALQDPRFNVRFEAIISVAHTRTDFRLTQALIDILNGTELALTAVAAWALGRSGSSMAVEPLRKRLGADYRSIRAHSARALGTLGDKASAPILLERLRTETDKGLQMAYASALGKLEVVEATADILHLLGTMENEKARMSLTLALVRIVGNEGAFIRLLRQVRADAGTAMSQTVTALRRKVGKTSPHNESALALMVDCADALAHNNLNAGAQLLGRLAAIPPPDATEACRQILKTCSTHMEAHGAGQIEYLLLALHALDAAWQS